jgi:hypothetical protein
MGLVVGHRFVYLGPQIKVSFVEVREKRDPFLSIFSLRKHHYFAMSFINLAIFVSDLICFSLAKTKSDIPHGGN